MDVKGKDVFKEDYCIGDPDLLRCVEEYYLESLQQQATQHGVVIERYNLDQEAGLEIRGTQQEVKKMLQYVKDVVRNIKVEHTQLEDGNYFFTDEGKKRMEDLEHRHGVVLKVDDKLVDTVRTAKTTPQEVTTIYQWTFPDNKQLFICRGRGEDTGACVVTDAFETTKDIDFKEQSKNKKAFVQFPVPNSNKPVQRKRLRKLVFDLFKKFCEDGLETFAIEVDSCQSWPLEDFTEVVLSSFIDYYLESCPRGFQLYLCVTCGTSDSKKVLKCCNDTLWDKHVNEFAFKQINEPIVKNNKMMKIEVLQGDICRIQADMIVNTTSPDLDLERGGASKALSRAAGLELQRELRTRYKHGLHYGEIAVTKGHFLPCRYVLHGVLNKYDEKTCDQVHKTEEDFYKASVHVFMTDCLREAERLHCSTISFPVIGTGSLFYPVYIVAEQMFETIQGYEFNSKLQSVNIVIFGNNKEVLQMFQDLKRKHDTTHREEQFPEQNKMQKEKLLKIAGTDKGIKAAREELSKIVKEGEQGKTDECNPMLQLGQKLTVEPENNAGAKNTSFQGKSASRSLRNLSTSKHPMETSRNSVTTPTSPDELSRSRNKNDIFQKQSLDIARSTREDDLETDRRSQKRENRQYKSERDSSEEGRSKFDLSVTVTNGKREVTEHGQDKKEILKVPNIQVELLKFFLSDTIEKYLKYGCLLEYDENTRAIVLHGFPNYPGFDIKAVRLDVANSVEKIEKLQSMRVDVHTYDRGTIQKHADELSKGDVLCCVDKSAREITIHGNSDDKIANTAHQLKTRLGIIQETDRRNRSFPNTTEDSSDRDKQASLRTNGKDEHTPSAGTGGARPKTHSLEKQFSWSSDAEYVEIFQIGKIMVQVYKADIKNLPVDCIVNAANGKLQHGGGIARVISDAAGGKLNQESWHYVKRHGDLKVGTVCHTTAGRLRYKRVIHAVGPNWHDYRPYTNEDVRRCEKDLRSAVFNSIKKAEELGLKSIAIPGISAGIFACPRDLCFIQYSRAVWDYTKQASGDKMVLEVHFVDINKAIVKNIQFIFKEMEKAGNIPKWYNINQIVDEEQKRLKEQAENRRNQERKASQSKQNEQKSGYPYLSRKPASGQSESEFVCVVSPKLCLYVYTAEMFDIMGHVDIFACGEKLQGKVASTVSESIEKWCGSKFTDAKRRKMKSAKEGDVIIIPGSATTIKCVAFVILYQKKNTKNDEDRQQKMADIYKKLFMEAKKWNCKQLALPLVGTGKGNLKTGYATERLCEGLWAFSKGNFSYELGVHLINTDSKKTNESIKTVTTLVDKMNPKETSYPANKDVQEKGQPDKDQQTKHYKPARPDRPPSANYNHAGKPRHIDKDQSKINSNPAVPGRPQSGKQEEHDMGNKNMAGTLKTQTFSRTAPTGKEGLPSVYNAEKESSSEEESEDQWESDDAKEDEVKVKDRKPPDTDKPDSCVICMETLKRPRRLECGHEFCNDCIEAQFVYKEVCPICGRVWGLITGDQPEGEMLVTVIRDKSCAGYENYGRIDITYRFLDGKQGPDHPKPGQRYKGITRTSFLPDNKQGKLILEMLKIAFDRKLVFTIGSSRTTGQEGVITWNDIHHKTDPKPNTQFGYPDPTYLDRVTDELAAKGVTEKDVKKAAGK